MELYSPKRHDIAQLKYLCESLFDDSMNINRQSSWLG